MTLPVLEVSGLNSIEGMEALLDILVLMLKDSLNSYIQEVETEWRSIHNIKLPLTDENSFVIANDEDSIPSESTVFPQIYLFGFDDNPDESLVEQFDADLYRHNVAIRLWMKSSTPTELTRQIYRYAEAIKRTVKKFANGAQDSTGAASVVWVIEKIAGRYSSVSPTTPYFMACQVDFSIKYWREWS